VTEQSTPSIRLSRRETTLSTYLFLRFSPHTNNFVKIWPYFGVVVILHKHGHVSHLSTTKRRSQTMLVSIMIKRTITAIHLNVSQIGSVPHSWSAQPGKSAPKSPLQHTDGLLASEDLALQCRYVASTTNQENPCCSPVEEIFVPALVSNSLWYRLPWSERESVKHGD
jgi:hypothetical protein